MKHDEHQHDMKNMEYKMEPHKMTSEAGEWAHETEKAARPMHHDHHAMMIADYRRRFWVSLVLTIPILVRALLKILFQLAGGVVQLTHYTSLNLPDPLSLQPAYLLRNIPFDVVGHCQEAVPMLFIPFDGFLR